MHGSCCIVAQSCIAFQYSVICVEGPKNNPSYFKRELKENVIVQMADVEKEIKGSLPCARKSRAEGDLQDLEEGTLIYAPNPVYGH